MFKYQFDPKRSYVVVVYLRMSDEGQNPRSPETQLAMIKLVLKKLGYRWKIIKVYRDDAITGRFVRRRPGFQQMLSDLKTRTVKADMVLVDTKERFGRADEMDSIRRELFNLHGVVVLAADTNFLDPNTPHGKAMAMLESYRASEDGRIKAHNVLRGKRDKAELKEWPGGPAPFGLCFESTQERRPGGKIVIHSKLARSPETGWIMEELLDKVWETSWGGNRLSKWLNAHPAIPELYKPFHPDTVSYWIDSEIYYGELVWAANVTDIINDTRVMHPNEEADIIRIPDFWRGLIEKARWSEIQQVRQARRDRLAVARARGVEEDGKLIRTPAPGMTLRYLLSGLIYCKCGVRMTASSSATYVAKDGGTRRYVSYVCPSYLAGTCTNNKRVPEDWIRTAVINKLKERLFRSE